jgi:hypothetical protein
MKMEMIRSLIFCLGALLLMPPMLGAQDLSKYRSFSLGTSLPNLLKLNNQQFTDVKTIHARPLLLQELTWWPSSSSAASSRPDNVEQILFSFSNGELYRISVTYDRGSTKGLTATDMMKSISAKYGPATSVESEIDPIMNARYNMKQRCLASWQDSQFSVDLVLSSFTEDFGLVIYSKGVNAQADLASAEAVKLEEQERPEKEANQRKKEADDLQVTREKNQKSFRP